MDRCKLCNSLEKRHKRDPRLGFQFTPDELIDSASKEECEFCAIILEGLRKSEGPDWVLEQDVRQVYARCHEKPGGRTSSLFLEVYFTDKRSRIEYELFTLDSAGTSVNS
jgi:hypothetical protein